LTLRQKRTSRKLSKNGVDGGTGVYMREETTSRVMAADRPYGRHVKPRVPQEPHTTCLT
jgi:hypothetical protein